MAREEGDPPPCNVCPKVPDSAPAKSWEYADDFADWFWDARRWFLTRRVLGDFGTPDPLMEAVAVEFDAAERRADSAAAGGLAAALARLMTRA